MGIGAWVRVVYSAEADLFIRNIINFLYSIAYGKRIQEEGIGHGRLRGISGQVCTEIPPCPPSKGRLIHLCFDMVERLKRKRNHAPLIGDRSP
jgi:hypothetical protein